MSKDSKVAKRSCRNCGADTYKTGLNRRTKCTTQPTCVAGQYISKNLKTKRRTCTPCSAGSHTNVADQFACKPCEVNDALDATHVGFAVAAGAKKCDKHTVCTLPTTVNGVGQYETKAASPHHDRECASLAVAVKYQFISKVATPTTDRVMQWCQLEGSPLEDCPIRQEKAAKAEVIRQAALAKAKLLREAAAPGLQQARKVRLGATTTVAPLSKENWNCALDGCSPGSWCADDQRCKHHTTCHVEQTQVRAGDKNSDTVCSWNANSGVPCLHIACQHTNEKLINVVHRKNEAPRFKFHHCNHRDEGPTCKCRCHLGSREAEHVNNTPAPLDGGWSPFSEFGRCHSECTVETGPAGWKSKYRACNSPKPANGGAFCKGADWETVPCTDSACDKPMPVVKKP
jgi:hypothetical protein